MEILYPTGSVVTHRKEEVGFLYEVSDLFFYV